MSPDGKRGLLWRPLNVFRNYAHPVFLRLILANHCTVCSTCYALGRTSVRLHVLARYVCLTGRRWPWFATNCTQ